MSVGLIALLDDVATLAKTAAVTLDDIAGAAAKAATKSAGVVIDDAAVTPRYVVGFASDRELPIIYKITRGSLFNKLIILLPAALLLSLVAPWSITPLLMLGGLFLCYEGSEKVFETIFPHAAHEHEKKVIDASSPEELENKRVSGAIKTDFILSAEIMAITLSTVADQPLITKAGVLFLVGLLITLGVYGAVALIVRADDFGMALAQRRGTAAIGRAIVKAMPFFLKLLAIVGTAAMIWVGGGIVIHGLAQFGFDAPEHWLHDLAERLGGQSPFAPGFMTWLVSAVGSGITGLVLGFLLIPIVGKVIAPIWQKIRPAAKST